MALFRRSFIRVQHTVRDLHPASSHPRMHRIECALRLHSHELRGLAGRTMPSRRAPKRDLSRCRSAAHALEGWRRICRCLRIQVGLGLLRIKHRVPQIIHRGKVRRFAARHLLIPGAKRLLTLGSHDPRNLDGPGIHVASDSGARDPRDSRALAPEHPGDQARPGHGSG